MSSARSAWFARIKDLLAFISKRRTTGPSPSRREGVAGVLRGFTSLSQTSYLLGRCFAHKSRAGLAPVVAYPFATAIMAVTFVESYFNELIAVAEDQGALSAARAEELRTANPVEKLDGFLLELTGGRSDWNWGQDPYQSFRQLLTLRHELVHYKPEFVPMGQFPDAAIEQLARRFRHEWFGRCDWTVAVLTAAVADWACQTVKQLVEEFHRIIGTRNPWQVGMPGWEDEAWRRLL